MADKLNQKSDIELCKMLGGDKKTAKLAFDEIYQRYSQRVYTYCKKYVNNQDLADDIFQEVFLQLYTSSSKGIEIKNLSPFLLTIARNKCFNENSRLSNNTTSIEDFDIGFTDRNYLENEEISNIVNLAINALPEQYREVIIMKEHLDMSYQEIADATNQALSNVRIKIYRAKEKLREILEPYLNDIRD